MDAWLEGFAGRISDESLTETALRKVVRAFRSKCGLPFQDIMVKFGGDRGQAHIDDELEWLGADLAGAIGEKAEVYGSGLAEWANENLTLLNTLELPRGCKVSLWQPPIRLVADYCINKGIYIYRFDVIGVLKGGASSQSPAWSLK